MHHAILEHINLKHITYSNIDKYYTISQVCRQICNPENITNHTVVLIMKVYLFCCFGLRATHQNDQIINNLPRMELIRVAYNIKFWIDKSLSSLTLPKEALIGKNSSSKHKSKLVKYKPHKR